MLLSRPPLATSPKTVLPFDLHVLGTPPAFILSQDQTLRQFSVSSETHKVASATLSGSIHARGVSTSHPAFSLCFSYHCSVVKVRPNQPSRQQNAGRFARPGADTLVYKMFSHPVVALCLRLLAGCGGVCFPFGKRPYSVVRISIPRPFYPARSNFEENVKCLLRASNRRPRRATAPS